MITYNLKLTSFLRNACMRISFFSWSLIDLDVLLNWNERHDLRTLFIFVGTTNLHHASSLGTFQRWRSTALAMVLMKLFLHAPRYTRSLRLSYGVDVWLDKWIVCDGSHIVGVSWAWYIWTFSIACRSNHTTFFDCGLADITHDVSRGCIVVTRGVDICLTLYRIIVIEVYRRNKIDTVCIVVISRCNRGH